MNTIDAKKFYNEVMPTTHGADYEKSRWHSSTIAQIGYEQTRSSIVTVLPKAAPEAILEIGPGAGTWTKLLLAKYPEANVTLVDISREMLNRAKETLKRDDINYCEADFSNWSGDHKFDLVFSSRMLEYVNDKKAFMFRLKEVTHQGGTVILITKFPHYGRQKMLGKKVSQLHQGQIDPRQFRQLLKDQGFEIIEQKAVTVSVPLLKSPLVNRWVGKLIKLFPLNPATNVCLESYLTIARLP